ncbi:hypothetical protein MYE70_10570 [Marinobacter alexandrii]|uniref:hypothetical protein n=1 Tax=Marinobacter alexandrii TaxID=2570351 RepID=UPI001FFE9520|nr:hypothetical protein [Marinobacter alexandrii]MCK2149509.1 hypothetical protein [Marinobacter alexandrii]
MTITIGTWVFPLAFTIFLFVVIYRMPVTTTRKIYDVAASVIVAAPGSLVAWLVWWLL